MIKQEIMIRVHPSLEEELRKIKEKIMVNMHKRYNINIDLNQNVASQLAANKLKGKRNVNFKIEKKGLNQGVIRLM